MKFEFWMNGIKVTKKEFMNAYGEQLAKEIIEEIKAEPVGSISFLNGGLDEIHTYN